MADYHSRFSCVLDVGSEQNVALAMSLFEQRRLWDPTSFDAACVEEMALEPEPAFDLARAPRNVHWLWMNDGGYGSPEYVTRFVLFCAERFGLQGRWGFQWAFTCSAPAVNGFGGGATILDLDSRTVLDAVDCDSWLHTRLAE